MQPTASTTPRDTTERKPRHWRVVVGFGVTIAAGVASGAMVASAGFGVFPAWLFFTLLTPLVAAFAAPTRRRLMAVLAAVLMNGMVVGRIAFFPDGGYPPQMSQFYGVLFLVVLLGAFSVMTAWAIGYAVAAIRPAA